MTTPASLCEAEMEAKARRAVMESGDWLTANEILQLRGVSSHSDCAQPSQWIQQGDIFTINDHGTDYYPAFGLEKEAGYRPYSVMSKIIDIFKEDKDGWGMAFWFQSINSYLGALKPQDLIATDPDLVIDAALDEVRGVTHG
ncbi:hypothetical protein [Vreelandella neptunia]|uniref:Antitoxin Xre/MbcA/ParS-like toxin-binding domain-containing protein n=1 Tax=Vreelandella neptunia TaxID=115551 RepID=A0ABS9S8R4_9GAMM|nr:hypothetical protein [Halomonas neptunia]MCH4812485.1 hypothetical protein [Halomonas neptunia]TDV99895.1 hypothetical protein BDK62_10144 [Halomonas alkaliantarctica]